VLLSVYVNHVEHATELGRRRSVSAFEILSRSFTSLWQSFCKSAAARRWLKGAFWTSAVRGTGVFCRRFQKRTAENSVLGVALLRLGLGLCFSRDRFDFAVCRGRFGRRPFCHGAIFNHPISQSLLFVDNSK